MESKDDEEDGNVESKDDEEANNQKTDSKSDVGSFFSQLLLQRMAIKNRSSNANMDE